MKKNQPLGLIVYEGPSRLDGAPIVVILNRIFSASANDKTGDLVQSFIIRSDIPPIEALKTGADASICGDCGHRPAKIREAKAAGETPEPPCYVKVFQSVRSVYDAYKRGRYQKATPKQAARIIAGKKLRIGTYGDGAAAPVDLWEELTAETADHVGYSHQWKRRDFDATRWSRLVMASADSLDDAALANLYGMRTFRVSIGLDKQPAEALCPASAQAGRKTTCSDCMLCAGTSKAARDIVIPDHATGHARRVIQLKVEA
jgi:hypothetical protein